jgi:hypothetical protein
MAAGASTVAADFTAEAVVTANFGSPLKLFSTKTKEE